MKFIFLSAFLVLVGVNASPILLAERHVPGRSPWGGYDISHTAIDPDRIVEGAKPLRLTSDFPMEPNRSAASSDMGLSR